MIERRTPLSRKSAGQLKRSRIKPRSDKQAEVYDERRPLVDRLLRARPKCEARVVCTGDPSVDVHEILSRGRGGKIIDLPDEAFLCVCRACHDWTDRYNGAAQCLGLLVPSWAFNVTDDPWAVAKRLRERQGEPCPWRDLTRDCASLNASQQACCEPLPDSGQDQPAQPAE